MKNSNKPYFIAFVQDYDGNWSDEYCGYSRSEVKEDCECSDNKYKIFKVEDNQETITAFLHEKNCELNNIVEEEETVSNIDVQVVYNEIQSVIEEIADYKSTYFTHHLNEQLYNTVLSELTGKLNRLLKKLDTKQTVSQKKCSDPMFTITHYKI